MHENPHHVLRAKFVLARQFPVVTGGVHEKHLVTSRTRPILTQNEQASRYSGTVENIQRQRNDRIYDTRFKKSLPDQMFVVRLASLDDWVSLVVEFTSLLLDLRLTAEKNALRAHNTSSASVV
jgi:hypothetical protein